MTTSRTFIPYASPLIGEEEIAEVVDTLRSAWITTGPKTARFEQELAQLVGAPGALGVNSCTAALHTALAALGIGPGDEVITTTMTFCATVNVIIQVGATPVLVDVEPDTLNIDPAQVARAITPRTRAIVPVHYGGHPVDLDPLLALAETHHLHLVEDAAHALPARYKGRLIGSGENPVAFSFYATKNITTGEGGMLTGTPEFLAVARIWALHGMSRDAWRRYEAGGSWRYDVVLPGFKYNMMDLQAALGLSQLRKLPQFQARRQAIAAQYNAAFGENDALELPTVRPEVETAWHLYALRLVPEALTIDRDQFVRELTERGIGTSVHFIPIHLHPYYRAHYAYAPEDFPVAYGNFQRIFSIPLNPGLSEGDVTRIIEAVTEITTAYRR